MQSGFTGHVTRAEWRWILIVSILLVGLSFAPFLWVFVNNAQDSSWQFMGALHAHIDVSAYLSRIRQGMEGNLLVEFFHTPERQSGYIIQIIYPLLGQIGRLASDSLSPILVFHVARVSVTVFMYLALYQLAATIWMRIRTRRIFFVLVSVGSGLGWILLVITGGQYSSGLPIDLILPQMSPFFAGLVSVHVPLAIACMALLAAVIIEVFRPGMSEMPNVRNTGLLGFGLGIALVFLYPEAYILLAIVLILTVGLHWYFARKTTEREMRWLMWILVPALPVLLYYVLILRNPIILQWVEQRSQQRLDITQLVLGLGVIFVIGLPSVWRALRRFESDGDRFMILWLIVALIGALLPIVIRVDFLTGIMIPVAYFASRSIEDVWMKYFSRRYRYRIFALLVPFVMISNLFALVMPLVPLSSDNPTDSAGLVLSTEYRVALEWLNHQTNSNDVVMASPDVGIWIPVWVGSHTIVGHPTETMQPTVKKTLLEAWYGLDHNDVCLSSLMRLTGINNHRFGVHYVIYGPREADLGDGTCLSQLDFLANFGEVAIYRVPILFPR